MTKVSLFQGDRYPADHTMILDVARDLGGTDPEKSFLEPIQKSLDQCKSAKVAARHVSLPLRKVSH
jgi:hypothetical protein